MTVKEAREIALTRKPVFGDKELSNAFVKLLDYRELLDILEQSDIDMIQTALEELDIDMPTRKCTCELEIIVKQLDPNCTVHSSKNQKSDQNVLKQNENVLSLPASMEDNSTGNKQES